MKRTLRAAIAIALAAMVNPLLAQTCWHCVSDGGNPPFYSCVTGAPGWHSCTSLGDGGCTLNFPCNPSRADLVADGTLREATRRPRDQWATSRARSGTSPRYTTVALASGRVIEKACSGAVVARAYDTTIRRALRKQARVIHI